MVKIFRKLVCVLLLIMLLANTFSGIVSAITISNAKILNLGDCGYHLQYWDESRNVWSYVVTTLVGYEDNGVTHYAYCLNKDAHGVGTVDSYDVDINTLLDDVQVWRTITAGFPYRTAEQMGCTTNEDAFVATKQAVYCIIYGFNPESRFKGGDTRGEQIKNAIVNLVNEGRSGTRTPASADVKINCIGNIINDENYVCQEMSVSSFVNIGSYSITEMNGLPTGSKIVNMNNNEQNTFSSDEHFKIEIPKDLITDDMNVNLAVSAKCETYPVLLGKAPSGDLQNYALTYDAMSDERGNLNFNIDAHKCSLKIIKEDAEQKYRMPGVVFNFKYSDGTDIGEFTTDENGEIFIDKLKPGTVIATEIKTRENYVLDDKEHEIKLSYADKNVQTILNERIKGNIEVNVNKKGTVEIKPGENVDYDFYNISNKSNVSLDDFRWIDYIPSDCVRLLTMQTGIWNQDLNYNVYYKTNKSDDYILFAECLNTMENHNLNFSNLELENDEYVVETMFDFGKVGVDFQENTSPTMQCKSLNTLKNGTIFTNKTKTVGKYFESSAEADSEWNTIVYLPQVPQIVLPKTGN